VPRRTATLLSGLRRFAREERGTQLVELAIVLPVLLVMFGAVAEFGRFFYTYQTLAKATRAGARYLTTKSGTTFDDEAARLVVYGDPDADGEGEPAVHGLSVGHVTVTREGVNTAMPERVTVSIEGFTYQPMFDLGALLGSRSLSLNVEMRQSTTMRIFNSTPAGS
jgi:Flp pilus assembly protein TadG